MKRFWNNLAGRFRKNQVRQLPWGVLGILISIAIISIGWSIFQTGDWAGAALNFGTDMAGAVVIYLLLEFVLGTRQRKEQLIAQMGSKVRDVAIAAVEELSRNNWLSDGSLQGANFMHANLERVDLSGADLRDVNLFGANLQNATLNQTNLEGATLMFTDLTRAGLVNANIKRVDLWGAELDSAVLISANLGEANLFRAKLPDARLDLASLNNANLDGAELINATLHEADLRGATYTAHTVWPDGFDPVAAGAILVEDDDRQNKVW